MQSPTGGHLHPPPSTSSHLSDGMGPEHEIGFTRTGAWDVPGKRLRSTRNRHMDTINQHQVSDSRILFHCSRVSEPSGWHHETHRVRSRFLAEYACSNMFISTCHSPRNQLTQRPIQNMCTHSHHLRKTTCNKQDSCTMWEEEEQGRV